MKKIILAIFLIMLGIAGSVIYTSKPEAKAGFTSRSFRINLKNGVDSLAGYFGNFGENGSWYLGEATGPNTYPEQNHLFDNWQGSLIIHFDATLKGPTSCNCIP